MTRKPISWAQAGLMFLWMAACTFGLTMALNSTMRYQAGSIHSMFWQFVFPSDLVAAAALAFGGRFILNWGLTRCYRKNLETHKAS
jgi:hypothetical protein